MIKNKIKGSSETTCKETHFLNWLIGFVEGDGSFVIPKERPPQFEITQHIHDIDVLYKIKSFLKFGTIIKRKERSVGVYQVIGNYDHLLKLANLFNGKLKCPRRKIQFKKWTTELKKYRDFELEYNSQNSNVTLDDAWLSGFIDAEGCFESYIRPCKTSKLREILVLKFSISQKTPDILIKIKDCLNLPNKISFDKSWNGYKISTQSLKNQYIIIKYIKNFPLKTRKNINFLIYKNLIEKKRNKLYITKEELEKIKKKLNKFKV